MSQILLINGSCIVYMVGNSDTTVSIFQNGDTSIEFDHIHAMTDSILAHRKFYGISLWYTSPKGFSIPIEKINLMLKRIRESQIHITDSVSPLTDWGGNETARVIEL